MPDLRCSFCNKPQADVRKLVAGVNGLICDECIKVAVGLMSKTAAQTPQETKNPPAPGADSNGDQAPPAMRILPSSE